MTRNRIQQPTVSGSRTTAAWYLTVVCTAVIAVGLTATSASAQEDPPTGGGTGCVSNGNCSGTLYSDPSVVDRWWWGACSGCHVVQGRKPANASTVLTKFQRELLSDRTKFHAMHDMAMADPVLQRLMPKSKLLPTSRIATQYQALLRRPR